MDLSTVFFVSFFRGRSEIERTKAKQMPWLGGVVMENRKWLAMVRLKPGLIRVGLLSRFFLVTVRPGCAWGVNDTRTAALMVSPVRSSENLDGDLTNFWLGGIESNLESCVVKSNYILDSGAESSFRRGLTVVVDLQNECCGFERNSAKKFYFIK